MPPPNKPGTVAASGPLVPQKFYTQPLGNVSTLGVEVSKLVAYAVLLPNTGVDVSKLNTYTTLLPKDGVDVTKLNAYAVLVNTVPSEDHGHDNNGNNGGNNGNNNGNGRKKGPSLDAFPFYQTLYYQEPWEYFQDEIVAQPPAFQVDEDFWVNPTPPPPIVLYPQQWTFDEQSPVLYGQFDEDFWTNSVAPVPLTFIWTQQWTFDEQVPALFGQFDEDFWLPQIPQQPYTVYAQPFSADESIVAQPVITFQPDEDFWISLPYCILSSYILQQFLFDSDGNGTIVPPHIVVPKILRWGHGSRMTPPYNP